MVPEVGLEPTWDCSRQILSLVRIPISPLRREVSMIRFRLGEVKTSAVGVRKEPSACLRTLGKQKGSRRARKNREENEGLFLAGFASSA